jgi:hypothetical protein
VLWWFVQFVERESRVGISVSLPSLFTAVLIASTGFGGPNRVRGRDCSAVALAVSCRHVSCLHAVRLHATCFVLVFVSWLKTP